MNTREKLRQRYGELLTVKDLAELLKMSIDSVRAAISRETLGITTFRLPGRRNRLAKVEDVARYLERGKG